MEKIEELVQTVDLLYHIDESNIDETFTAINRYFESCSANEINSKYIQFRQILTYIINFRPMDKNLPKLLELLDQQMNYDKKESMSLSFILHEEQVLLERLFNLTSIYNGSADLTEIQLAIQKDDVEAVLKLLNDDDYEEKEPKYKQFDVACRQIRYKIDPIPLCCLFNSVNVLLLFLRWFEESMDSDEFLELLQESAPHAIYSGNNRIINLFKAHGVDFDGCLLEALMFHRNDLYNQILISRNEKIKNKRRDNKDNNSSSNNENNDEHQHQRKCKKITIKTALKYRNPKIALQILKEIQERKKTSCDNNGINNNNSENKKADNIRDTNNMNNTNNQRRSKQEVNKDPIPDNIVAVAFEYQLFDFAHYFIDIEGKSVNVLTKKRFGHDHANRVINLCQYYYYGGNSPLHIAALFQEMNLAQMLLEKGANLLMRGGYEYSTPISIAIRAKKFMICKSLISTIESKMSDEIHEEFIIDSLILSSYDIFDYLLTIHTERKRKIYNAIYAIPFYDYTRIIDIYQHPNIFSEPKSKDLDKFFPYVINRIKDEKIFLVPNFWRIPVYLLRRGLSCDLNIGHGKNIIHLAIDLDSPKMLRTILSMGGKSEFDGVTIIDYAVLQKSPKINVFIKICNEYDIPLHKKFIEKNGKPFDENIKLDMFQNKIRIIEDGNVSNTNKKEQKNKSCSDKTGQNKERQKLVKKIFDNIYSRIMDTSSDEEGEEEEKDEEEIAAKIIRHKIRNREIAKISFVFPNENDFTYEEMQGFLKKAIEESDICSAKFLLSKGADLKATDQFSPILLAAIQYNPDIFDYLITQNPDLYQPTRTQFFGNIWKTVAEKLIAKGMSLNPENTIPAVVYSIVSLDLNHAKIFMKYTNDTTAIFLKENHSMFKRNRNKTAEEEMFVLNSIIPSLNYKEIWWPILKEQIVKENLDKRCYGLLTFDDDYIVRKGEVSDDKWLDLLNNEDMDNIDIAFDQRKTIFLKDGSSPCQKHIFSFKVMKYLFSHGLKPIDVNILSFKYDFEFDEELFDYLLEQGVDIKKTENDFNILSKIYQILQKSYCNNESERQVLGYFRNKMGYM